MRTRGHYAIALGIVAALTTTAHAQQPTSEPIPNMPDMSEPEMPGAGAMAPPVDDPGADDEPAGAEKTKEPKRGDFDAGGRVRLPNGPDEMGQYGTFNWVAVDAGGRYYLLDSVVIAADMPIALIKPDTVGMGGPEPSMFGGIGLTLDARVPEGPFMPKKYEAKVKVLLGASYMREGAMLLSEKDFPMFTGSFQPGFVAGLSTRMKMSELVDFQLDPVYVQQASEGDSLMAVQIPLSLIVKTSDFLTVSADAGVYTGPDFAFGADDGGRITAGAAVTVKIGRILAHAGAGAASLLTGGMYPTVKDSLYIDLNVKFAK